MSKYEERQGAVAVSDIALATVLLLPGIHYPSDDKGRHKFMQGQTAEIKPAVLNGYEVEEHPEKKRIRVLFLLGGDPYQIRLKKALFHHGEYYVDGNSFRKMREKLVDIVKEETRKYMRGGADAVSKSI